MTRQEDFKTLFELNAKYNSDEYAKLRELQAESERLLKLCEQLKPKYVQEPLDTKLLTSVSEPLCFDQMEEITTELKNLSQEVADFRSDLESEQHKNDTQNKINLRKNSCVTLISAVISGISGALFTLLIEHFKEIAAFLYSLVQ